MKKCPYCAEQIQDEAVFCRFCRRDLPAIPAPQAQPSEPDHWLPPAYYPPDEVISQLYDASLQLLVEGAWTIAGEPSFVPRSISSPRNYAKILRKLAKEAWFRGGNSPEGAVKWLTAFENSRSLIKSLFSSEHSQEAIWAARHALGVYSTHTKVEVRSRFLLHLDGLIRRVQQRSHTAEEATALLSPQNESFDNEVPLDLLRAIYEEARRIIPALHVSGAYYQTPISQRPNFTADLGQVQARVLAILERRYGGNVSPKTGFRALLTEEEFEKAVTDGIAGDTRYTDKGGMAFVSLGARKMLSAKGYAIFPEEFVRQHRIV